MLKNIYMDLNDNITKNFKWSEFVSPDGQMKISEYTFELFYWLQIVRDIIDTPITINSGYRSVYWNEQVGGALHSYHMKAMAVDIGWDHSEWSLESVANLFEGFGLNVIMYDNFIHVDIRNLEEDIK